MAERTPEGRHADSVLLAEIVRLRAEVGWTRGRLENEVAEVTVERDEAQGEVERLRSIVRAVCLELGESWPETAAGFLREAGLAPPP